MVKQGSQKVARIPIKILMETKKENKTKVNQKLSNKIN